MGWLDKLLGREKKPESEMSGKTAATSEGMGQEQAAPAPGTPPSPEPPAQEEPQPPPGTP